MNNALRIAIFSVASYAITTGASSEEVYKCGNSYSQTPCPDAVRMDVQDARTAAQKAEADANTRREATTANAMEQARLKEEARQRAASATSGTAQTKKASPKPRATASAPAAEKTGAANGKGKKKSSNTKKEPALFTASPATDKPKPAAAANARK